MIPANKQHTCVFGLGWGDEGKGKVVDLLCPAFGAVVRFNGGANAGHTVCVAGKKFALHLLPAGVLHDAALGVIGPGVVVDPIALLSEIDELEARGVAVTGRLKISDRAHLVMPYHKLEDQLGERQVSDKARIGTTARGIGPCYADKMRRHAAFRFSDLADESGFDSRVRQVVGERKRLLDMVYDTEVDLDADKVLADMSTARARLKPCVCDTAALLHQLMDDGRTILFEGANGLLLDIDHGTYPFVTSSSTGPHGIGCGAGVSPLVVTRRIGVVKSYSTRVGSGPFMSELTDETGDRIREAGHEYGTTTGRPRRCGWFDAVACRYGVRLSAATDIALMHLDTLSGFDRVGICIGYRLNGETVDTLPADAACQSQLEPVMEYHSGWSEDLTAIRSFDELPATAVRYLERLESLIGAPITLVGVGPDRSQTLLRGDLTDLIDVPEPTNA